MVLEDLSVIPRTPLDDIKRWLQIHGLERYAELFVQNAIELDVLDELTVAELKKLEIPLGDQKRLLRAIAAGTEAISSYAATSSASTAPPNREAERRQLTMMFCDLDGSTALSESMGPADCMASLRPSTG